ncbi:hypothetical protein GCK32_012630 [Trichostrongylus colubriformis]|uniref:Uncharacterized protein n=1 Tax=Trichostrongylus colubriformis TaxID=6319 RepID=A0AAN8FSQ2_TRICO
MQSTRKQPYDVKSTIFKRHAQKKERNSDSESALQSQEWKRDARHRVAPHNRIRGINPIQRHTCIDDDPSPEPEEEKEKRPSELRKEEYEAGEIQEKREDKEVLESARDQRSRPPHRRVKRRRSQVKRVQDLRDEEREVRAPWRRDCTQTEKG